ncbi:MAG TPA: toll/interleukin-1 receptor domain-containing protein [Pyrinomonadaceae bacterium]|nr:toll/interleukin-1 receptor domain-containing protein [Pyrinomonadaceae bacterium]
MANRAISRKSGKPAAKQKASKRLTLKATTKAAEPSAYIVFISHSSKEKWIARQIAKEIEALGAKTWLDLKDIHGGDEIRRSIRRGIRASKEAIVLLSANSVTSDWVIYEVAIADAQGKRITPVLNNLSSDDVFSPLRGIKAVDLNDFNTFLVELAERIKNRLGRARKAAL